MAKSNKPVAIDIGGFMKQVQNNKPEKKDEVTEAAEVKVTLPEEAEEAEHADTLPESDESSPKEEEGDPKNGMCVTNVLFSRQTRRHSCVWGE